MRLRFIGTVTDVSSFLHHGDSKSSPLESDIACCVFPGAVPEPTARLRDSGLPSSSLELKSADGSLLCCVAVRCFLAGVVLEPTGRLVTGLLFLSLPLEIVIG